MKKKVPLLGSLLHCVTRQPLSLLCEFFATFVLYLKEESLHLWWWLLVHLKFHNLTTASFLTYFQWIAFFSKALHNWLSKTFLQGCSVQKSKGKMWLGVTWNRDASPVYSFWNCYHIVRPRWQCYCYDANYPLTSVLCLFSGTVSTMFNCPPLCDTPGYKIK